MYEALNRCIGEMEANLTDKEIAKGFHEYFQIVESVSEEYADNATVEDVRADHPEYGFLDHGKMRVILEQAKTMRHKREAPEKEYLTAEDMQELLRRNEDWGDAGSDRQHAWIGVAATHDMTIGELAGMVWVCTEDASIGYIEETMREYLKEKREKGRGSTAQSTDGYDVEFAEECIKTHMGTFPIWPYGDVKKIETEEDSDLRIRYAGGMYWHYREEDGRIIWW